MTCSVLSDRHTCSMRVLAQLCTLCLQRFVQLAPLSSLTDGNMCANKTFTQHYMRQKMARQKIRRISARKFGCHNFGCSVFFRTRQKIFLVEEMPALNISKVRQNYFDNSS